MSTGASPWADEQVLASFGTRALLIELVVRERRKRALRAQIDAALPPTPVQRVFHASTFKRRSFRGPNQGGKTKAGAREALYRMLGCHPDYPTNPVPIHGRVVTYSFKQSRVVQRALYMLCPKGQIASGCTFDYQRGFKASTLVLCNGSTCEIVTSKQGQLAHSGDTLDFVWFDEPPLEGHWSENLARLLIKNGDCWLTYTPVGRSVEWLKQECQEGRIEDISFKLTVQDCPFLTQAQIDDISSIYLPAEWDQRVNGAWEGVTTGRVFSKFHPEYSTFDIVPIDLDFRLATGWDHGEKSGKEIGLLIGVTGVEDAYTVWVLGEYVAKGGTHPNEDAEGLAYILDSYGWSLDDVLYGRGDVNSAGKLGAGATINELLEQGIAKYLGRKDSPFKIHTPDKTKGTVVSGCRVLNKAFMEGRLKVSKRCPHLIKSLRHWAGLNDALKDPLDALRYIAIDFLRDIAYKADRVSIV